MNKKITLLAAITMAGTLQLMAGIKIQHGPYLQNLDEHEATIVWVTDKPSTGWVETAPDDGTHFYAEERPKTFDTKIGIKNTSRVHAVKLTGLQPGTVYRYRVCSQEITSHEGAKVTYGDITSSDVFYKAPPTFTTNDHGKPDVKFAMVNDIHGRNDVLEDLISQCDFDKTDLILFNGDMASVLDNEEHMFGGFMDKAVDMFAKEVPVYYCRGNHETRGAMAPYMKDYFNPLIDEMYFMFRQGPVCFVVLDCGEDKPDSDVEYYGITDYDGYRTRQAAWLKAALQSKMYTEAPFKVVVCHMPPFGGWHGEREIAAKFIPLLNEAKPDVYLSAHLHKNIRHDAGEDGASFPLIVNSDKTLLKAEADAHKMTITIHDTSGKEIDRLAIEK